MKKNQVIETVKVMTETEKNEVKSKIEKAYKMLITKQKGTKQADIENQEKSLQITLINENCVKYPDYNPDILQDTIIFMLKNPEKFQHIKDTISMKNMIKAVMKKKTSHFYEKEKIRGIYFQENQEIISVDSESLDIIENIESQELQTDRLTEIKETFDFFQERIKNENLSDLFQQLIDNKKPAEIAKERCLPIVIPTGLQEEDKEEFLEKQNALIFKKNLDKVNNQIRKLHILINEIIPEFSDSYRDNKALPRRPREYDYQTRLEIIEREFVKSLNAQEKKLYDFLRYKEYVKEDDISYISDIVISERTNKKPIKDALQNQEVFIISDNCMTKKGKRYIRQEIVPFTEGNKSEIQLIIAQAKQGIFNKLEIADISVLYQQLYKKIKSYIPEIIRGYQKMKSAINVDAVKKRIIENQELTRKTLDILTNLKQIIKENSTEQENTTEKKSQEFQAIQSMIAEMFEIQGFSLRGIADYCNNEKIPNVIAKNSKTLWNYKQIQKMLEITEKNGKVIKEKKIMPTVKKTGYNQGIDKLEHEINCKKNGIDLGLKRKQKTEKGVYNPIGDSLSNQKES